MTLTAFAELAEVIGALAVVASLAFVGVQLRQNTIQLQRVEKNATNSEASAIRQAILINHDVAELVHAAVHNTRALSPIELDRFNTFLWEMGYLALQFWDRTKYGLFSREEEFEKMMQSLSPYLTSAPGRIWWRTARTVFRSDFVAILEAALPMLTAPVVQSASRDEVASV